MRDIPWNHEAHLLRRTGGGQAVEGRGVLHELVGAFLEMSPEQQHGLSIRVAGPDWSDEYDEATIRELAARPEYTGAHGAFDTVDRPDYEAGAEPSAPADAPTIEDGVSAPAPAEGT